MRRFILPVFLMVVTMAGLVRSQRTAGNETDTVEETKKEVLKFEDERMQAMQRGDTETLDRMFADEVAWTTPGGELLTKAQVLANIKSQTQQYLTVNHDDRRLHVYGNTVVLTVHSVSTARYKGNTFNYPRRFTNVYLKRDGRWQLIAHTPTPVAAP